MDKTHLVKGWVHSSGADNVLPSKGKAFALGWKLLNDYLHFTETGRFAETNREMYDFTEFIDTFADHYAGDDDKLYRWIIKHGFTIIDALQEEEDRQSSQLPNSHCPLCSRPLSARNVARWDNGELRISVAGRAWCQQCADKMDNKNWLPQK